MEGEEEQFGDGANDKFDDPPTIGRRRDDEKKDAKNEATNENEKAGMRADDMNQTGTIGAQSLILPVICFGIIALIAMRLHRGHKKHA
jgi:hypothetical protein